jgi:hypothetical protein
MARVGVSITKSTAYRNSTQEFSNVYYYEMASLPSEADAQTMIDNIANLEKTFHSSAVTFVRGRVWSQVGTPSQNNMITQKNLSGTGARTTSPTTLDKERAWLFRLRAGSDSRGNPVYLRKYFHACGEFVSGQGVAVGVQAGTTSWSTTERNAQVAAMQAIGDANGSPGAPKLCAKSGRQSTAGESWQAHAFLEHRQLGDQWRAQ